MERAFTEQEPLGESPLSPDDPSPGCKGVKGGNVALLNLTRAWHPQRSLAGYTPGAVLMAQGLKPPMGCKGYSTAAATPE